MHDISISVNHVLILKNHLITINFLMYFVFLEALFLIFFNIYILSNRLVETGAAHDLLSPNSMVCVVNHLCAIVDLWYCCQRKDSGRRNVFALPSFLCSLIIPPIVLLECIGLPKLWILWYACKIIYGYSVAFFFLFCFLC